MSKLFPGYAQNRGFRSTSPVLRAKAINAKNDKFLRDMQLQRKLDRENAIEAHKMLQDSFKNDQVTRQYFQQIEVQVADKERQAKKDIYDGEMARIQQESKDKINLYESLSGISKTAGEIIKKEADKQKEAELELGKNLTLQYGINGQELNQLEAFEGGLADFNAAQAPVIQRLRREGIGEKDLTTLMQGSGWSSYGAALGAVMNAPEDYETYLTANRSKPVVINGTEMTLEKAESAGDVAAVSGIFDRLRSDFMNEKLPGYDPAFVAKHARKGMMTAESRRKRKIETRIEEKSRDLNDAKEKSDIVIAAKSNPTNGNWFNDHVEIQAGGMESESLPYVRKRALSQLAELGEMGVLDQRHLQNVMDTPVFHKGHNKEIPLSTAFPDQWGKLKKAVDNQQKKKIETRDAIRREEKIRGSDFIRSAFEWGAANPGEINDKTIREFQIKARDMGASNSDINSLAGLVKYSTDYKNDQEFIEKWEDDKAYGRFPTPEEILTAGLSPKQFAIEMKERKDFEDSGFSKDIRKQAVDRIETHLRGLLKENYGNTMTLPPESFYSAQAHALKQVVKDFKIKYQGNEQEALDYAISQFVKSADADTGLYAVEKAIPGKTFVPGFTTFMGVQPKVNDPARTIAPAIEANPEAYKTESFIPTSRIKNWVNNINQGKSLALPQEAYLIKDLLLGKVNPMDIMLAQYELARKEDNTISELRPEVTKIFENAEQQVSPSAMELIRRYDSRPTVNRSLVDSGEIPVFDHSDPIYSFYSILDKVGGFPTDLYPTLGAVMFGESGAKPGNDTVKSGSDPHMRNEYSIGLLQVNTQWHMDKVRAMGYTMEDLRDPVRNVEIARMVYEEWIGVLMAEDPSLERSQAEILALDRWGAWGNGKTAGKGPYLEHMNRAQEAHTRWLRDKELNLPTWEQSSHMNPTAQRWLDKRGGVWAA